MPWPSEAIMRWELLGETAHRYYVSYWWQDGAAHGNGGLVVDLEGPVRSAEHVTDLGIAAHEDGQLPDGARVVIANIVRLDWP